MSEVQDVIAYQGEDYDVETGLTEADVVLALRQVVGGLANATASYEIRTDSEGREYKYWTVRDGGGTKG